MNYHLPPSTRVENFRGWILYDAQCGFCAHWIPYWQPKLARGGFDVMPLQGEAAQVLQPPSEWMQEMPLITRNGNCLMGFDAYLYAMRSMQGFKILSHVFSWPGFYCLGCAAYRLFARNRYRISQWFGWDVCDLENREILSDPKLMRTIKQSLDELENGKIYPAKDFFKE